MRGIADEIAEKPTMKDVYAFSLRMFTPIVGALCLFLLNSMTTDIKDIKTSLNTFQLATVSDISDMKARIRALEDRK